MSIEPVMPSNHLTVAISHFAFNLTHHQSLFQLVGSFPMSQPFTSGSQAIGTLAAVLVLVMNIHG